MIFLTPTNNTSNHMLNDVITKEEIEKAISNLKNDKACEYIKHSRNKMLDIYVKLFNLIFDSGKIPEQDGKYHTNLQKER